MRKIVLASASPRRKELLSQIGIDFRIDVSKADENAGSHEPGRLSKTYRIPKQWKCIKDRVKM